jgi:peptide chain release factor 1
MKRNEVELARRKDRKEQVGSGERHERIRTYHYLQDRVTDHRLNVSMHGIEGFLEGREDLDHMIQLLQEKDQAKAIKLLTTRS